MADKKQEDAKVAVIVPFFYGDAIPGDTVTVDAAEAERLIGMGGTLSENAAPEAEG